MLQRRQSHKLKAVGSLGTNVLTNGGAADAAALRVRAALPRERAPPRIIIVQQNKLEK